MPSYYEALPIYKAAMDVAVRVDAVVQRFAKGHKYTLGGRLRETTLDVVVLVARCNRRAERARELPVLCDRIEELKLMVNLQAICWCESGAGSLVVFPSRGRWFRSEHRSRVWRWGLLRRSEIANRSCWSRSVASSRFPGALGGWASASARSDGGGRPARPGVQRRDSSSEGSRGVTPSRWLSKNRSLVATSSGAVSPIF